MKKIRIAILLGIIVSVSFWVGSRYGATPSGGTTTQNGREILYYVDPMTPGFRSDSPGTAPCGMPLEPVYADADGTQAALPEGAVRVNPQRQQLIGVQLATVKQQPITHTLRLYGRVVPDETRVYRINAAVDSWVRELSNVTTGSFVKKDQILAEVLSPSYYNAQVTYLLALNNMDRIKEQLGGELRHQQGEMANNSIRVSVQALQNLGISDAQVEELARTRKARPYLQVRSPASGFVLRRNLTLNQWFKAAEEFYTIADIRKVWVYADVYENEARHLPPGTAVQVKHAQLGKTFDATVSEVLPLFDPISKTLKVRLDIDNNDFDLRPDMFVDVEIPITLPSSIYVPADAIINTGMSEVLYVDLGDGAFEPRQVVTGVKLGRWVEVIKGLMPGETFVASGNFLIDSESRMKTAGAEPAATKHKDLVCGMDVDEAAAKRDGRFLVLGDQTYYFCNMGCLESFHADPEKYLGPDPVGPGGPGQSNDETEAEGTAVLAIDPVCNMRVDPQKAQEAGLSVTLGGVTYYFCAPGCMREFNANHKKYAVPKPPANKQPNGGEMHGGGHEPHGEAKSAKAGHKPPSAGETRYQSAKDPGKQSMANPGVIDWDEHYNKDNDAPQTWPKGWGTFPGSKYLGAQDKPGPSSDHQKGHAAEHHDSSQATEGQAR